jgi:hypothetical protein
MGDNYRKCAYLRYQVTAERVLARRIPWSTHIRIRIQSTTSRRSRRRVGRSSPSGYPIPFPRQGSSSLTSHRMGRARSELPFGKGRHFSTSNSLRDAIAGGWQFTVLCFGKRIPFTPTAQHFCFQLGGASRPFALGELSNPTITRGSTSVQHTGAPWARRPGSLMGMEAATRLRGPTAPTLISSPFQSCD